MKSLASAIATSVYILSVASLSFGDGSTAKPLASSDGVPFPISDDRKVQVDLPVVRDKLGCLPGEMGRVFNAAKSAGILSKHLGRPLDCEWFVLGYRGYDAAGFDLENGRVVRIALARSKPDASNAIEKEISKLPGATTAKRQTISLQNKLGEQIPVIVDMSAMLISFEVDPVERYLMYHETPKAVADAMRSHVPIEGMTMEQANRCFGKPEESSIQGKDEQFVWLEWAAVAQPISSNDPNQALLQSQAAILNPKKHNTRRVEIIFRDGKAVTVNDSHFK